MFHILHSGLPPHANDEGARFLAGKEKWCFLLLEYTHSFREVSDRSLEALVCGYITLNNYTQRGQRVFLKKPSKKTKQVLVIRKTGSIQKYDP